LGEHNLGRAYSWASIILGEHNLGRAYSTWPRNVNVLAPREARKESLPLP